MLGGGHARGRVSLETEASKNWPCPVRPNASNVRSMADLTVRTTETVLADGDRFIQSYLLHLGSANSIQTAQESLLRAARTLKYTHPSQIPWAQLDYDIYLALKQRLAATYPPATANLTLAAVRGVLKIGWLRGDLPEALYSKAVAEGGVKGSRIAKGRALSEEEVDRLLFVAKQFGQPKGAMLRAILLLGIGTGMRRAELCSLSVPSGRTDGLSVIGKGNKERVCPLDGSVKAVLEEWLAIRSGLSWPHRMLFAAPVGGKPLTPRTLWWLFRELAALTEDAPIDREGGLQAVPAFAPHDLRRTFASRLLAGPFGLRDVQVFMAHVSPDTTARYDKRDLEALIERRRAFSVLGKNR